MPEFTVSFYDLRRLRLQGPIGVIAGKLEDVAGAVGAARPVDQRGGTRRHRLGKRMHPDAREIRDGFGAFAPANGWPKPWAPPLAPGPLSQLLP
jgi:hypothetical protein